MLLLPVPVSLQVFSLEYCAPEVAEALAYLVCCIALLRKHSNSPTSCCCC
jgi:hypothetical protein